jgi:hypothetical protein
MKRKIDEIGKSLVSSVGAKLEGTLVAHIQEKTFLVFPPSLLQDERLFNVFLWAGMRKRAHAASV